MPTPHLSDAEWKVMDALWSVTTAADATCTAREVRERIGDETGWAYTTVKTMLDRLVDKGALAADRRARTTRYRALISRSIARKVAMRGLLARAFDGGAGAMAHFLLRSEKLSAKDRATLRRMLDAIEAEEASAEEGRR